MKNAYFYYLLRRGVFRGGGNQIVNAFKTRVLDDDGIFEGFQCVKNALDALPQADAGRLIFEPYNTRVLADGGISEARTCTINAINSLL